MKVHSGGIPEASVVTVTKSDATEPLMLLTPFSAYTVMRYWVLDFMFVSVTLEKKEKGVDFRPTNSTCFDEHIQ